MQSRLLSTVTFACLLAGLATAVAAEPDAQHIALVIGSSAYKSMPALPSCTASAHVVSAALRHAGFKVTEQTDVTNGQLGAAVGAFASALGAAPDTRGVAYVCGYVADLDGRDFLLPASANIERDTDVLTQGLLAKALLDAVVRSGTRAGVVMLDAVAMPSVNAAPRPDSLAKTQFPTVGFAAAVSATAPPEGATLFAAAISAALTSPQVETGAMLRSIAAQLMGDNGPTMTISLPSEPAWLLGGPPPPAPPPPAPPPAAPPLGAAATPPSAPAPTPIPAPAQAAPAVVMPDEEYMTDADRRRIQEALLRLGYYDRQVDGIFGPDTRAAIRRFQHEIGAPMTGRISHEQASRLLDPRAIDVR